MVFGKTGHLAIEDDAEGIYDICIMHHFIAPFLVSAIACVSVAFSPVSLRGAYAASVWYVSPDGNDANTCNATMAPCATINGAIGKADGGDVIRVAIGRYTGSGDEVVLLKKSLTLSGGWDTHFAMQIGYSVLDGQNGRRVMSVFDPGAAIDASISRFILQNGYIKFGDGAGIYLNTVGGRLLVTNVVIRNNLVGDPCCTGGGGGAGIFVWSGRLEVRDSAIVSNNVILKDGSAYAGFTNAVASFINTTISNNEGNGALSNFSGEMRLYNSTVAGNSSGINIMGGKLTLSNSIVAQNKQYNCTIPPYYFSTFTSVGYNIIESSKSPYAYGCQLANADMDTDPKLNALIDDDPSQTVRALSIDSPAINAGNPAGCLDSNGNVITSDQRGLPRTGRCDIGASEAVVAITKTPGREILQPGDSILYTIRLRNVSSGGESWLTAITDTLPAQLTYVYGSLTSTIGTAVFSNGVVSWAGMVGPTETQIAYKAQVKTDVPINTTLTNTVTAKWSNITEVAQSPVLVGVRAYLPINTRDVCIVESFHETFDDVFSGWPIINLPSLNTGYENGEYKIRLLRKESIATVKAPVCTPSSYALEVEARWQSDMGNSYGLIFDRGTPKWYGPDFYLFEINTEYSMFRVLQHTPNGFEIWIPPTETNVIFPDRAMNRLTVVRKGSRITLAINGMIVSQDRFSDVDNPHMAGLLVSTHEDNPNADARFDNFRVYKQAPPSTTFARANTTEPSAPVDWPMPDEASLIWVK